MLARCGLYGPLVLLMRKGARQTAKPSWGKDGVPAPTEEEHAAARLVVARERSAAGYGSLREENPSRPGVLRDGARAERQGQRQRNESQTVTARQSGDIVARRREKSTPRCVAEEIGSGGEANATQDEQSAAFGAVGVGVVDRFVQLLGDHSYYPQALQRVVQGHEMQWKQTVRKAVQSLQEDLRVGDALQQFNEFGRVGRELLLRELRGKAVRILAHKKRKDKGNKK